MTTKDEAKEQPAQQEPVAWVEGEEIYWNNAPDLNDWIRQNGQPLYTSPQAQRTWVHATEWRGLTDDEVIDIAGSFDYRYDVARAAEAKLKEKNT